MTEFVSVDGGRIAYEVTGEGPLVVLAHGIGDDRFAYRYVTPELVRAGYRVAAVDLRGCGESTTDWPDFSRTAIAGDLLAVIEQLGGPAIVVGHSISGGAAVILAAQHPAAVLGVVGIAPVTRKPSLGLADLRVTPFRKAGTQLVLAGLLGSTKHWLSYLELAYPGNRPADWSARIARCTTLLADRGRMRAFQKMARGSAADAGAQLPHVRQPVLVVMGTRDPDWADPPAEAAGIVAALPSGRVELVDGAGHYPHDQYSDRVVSAVTGFIRSLGADA